MSLAEMDLERGIRNVKRRGRPLGSTKANSQSTEIAHATEMFQRIFEEIDRKLTVGHPELKGTYLLSPEQAELLAESGVMLRKGLAPKDITRFADLLLSTMTCRIVNWNHRND